MAAEDNWFDEKQSAWLYHALTRVERPGPVRDLFARLAEKAELQAGIWAERIQAQGRPLPEFRPTLRARITARLIATVGPRAMRPVLAAMKVRGLSIYDRRSVGEHPMPTDVEQVGRRHWGLSQGGQLRAAVFGANDGLVSNTSLIMGVAGASTDLQFVLLSGIAGLLAGGLSMAAGEYVSMRSQREMYEYQIGLEREELKEYPDEEAEELALIYGARGMEMQEARRVAHEMMQDPRHALDTLTREELGLNPDELGSPWGAALSSFLSFTAGALIPLIPYLIGLGVYALPAAAGLTGVSLFLIGMALSLFTGRRALRGGLRMVVIGGGAGLITYGIGHWLGVGLG